jgi:hypothetical protein
MLVSSDPHLVQPHFVGQEYSAPRQPRQRGVVLRDSEPSCAERAARRSGAVPACALKFDVSRIRLRALRAIVGCHPTAAAHGRAQRRSAAAAHCY